MYKFLTFLFFLLSVNILASINQEDCLIANKTNFQNWIVGILDFSRVDIKSKYIIDKKLNLSSLESKQLNARLIDKSHEFENKYDYEYNL